MIAALCAIIAALSLALGWCIRSHLRAEAARERDEAIEHADYDGWMP